MGPEVTRKEGTLATAQFIRARRQLPVRAALVGALILGLVGVSPALAAPRGLPAPSRYNIAPYCKPRSGQLYLGTYCGPWNVPLDRSNPFADSYGECVYWAIEKRPDIWNNRSANDSDQHDWDAWTWVGHAEAEGLSVNGIPRPGDVAVWSRALVDNATGHVAYVESVSRNGSITVSEMNHYFGGEGDREVLPPKPAPVGWKGLVFIHLPASGYIAGRHGEGGRPGGSAPASASRRRASIRMRLSDMRRVGERMIVVSVRITRGRGITRAVARADGRLVRLQFRRVSAHDYVLRARLSSGKWTLEVWCEPAAAYAAPRPLWARVRIP